MKRLLLIFLLIPLTAAEKKASAYLINPNAKLDVTNSDLEIDNELKK